jgi:hypothetical protein
MVIGKHRIEDYKKFSKIIDDFDDHAARGIRCDVHRLMERIFGFMQSH